MALNDLQLFAEQEAQYDEQKRALTQSANFALEQQPSDYAELLKLSAKTGVAPEIAKDVRPELERRQKMSDLSIDDIVRSNPRTAAFLADPNNMAVGQNDVGVFKTIEDTFKAIPYKFEQGYDKQRQMFLNYKEVIGQITPSEQAELANLEKLGKERAQKYSEGLPSWFGAASDVVGMQAASVLDALKNEGTIGMGAGATTGAALGLIGGPGAPVTVTAGGAAGATKGLAVGTATGYGINMYESAVGEAFSDLKEFEMPDGTKLDPTVARYAAVIIGVPNTALEAFALGKALKLIPGADKVIGKLTGDQMKQILAKPTMRAALADIGKKYAGAVAAETFTEGLQKFVNIIGREIAQEVSPGEFGTYTGEQFDEDVSAIISESTEAFKASVVLGGLGGGVRVYQARQDVAKAEQNQAVFEALGAAADGSETRKNVPAKFREFVEQATKDGPVENVYIEADRFNRFFQSIGINPEQVAAELGVTNQFDVATDKTDIVIPIGTFAEKIAGTEYLGGLMPDLRLNMGDPSMREAQAFQADEEARIAELEGQMEQLVAEQQRQGGLDRAIEQAVQDIEGQLRSVGYAPDAARKTATVMRGAAVLAQRDVVARAAEQGREATADEIYQAAATMWQNYGLTVSRPMPDVLTTNPNRGDIRMDPLIDRLRAGDIPGDDQIFGTSLSEFIRQAGGLQPRGELVDADVGRRPFERNLVQAGGMDIDRAAMLAVEAGYFPGLEVGALTESDFINAIEEELRGGQITYAAQNLDYDLLQLRDQLMQLDGYLQQLGIDISAIADNAVVRDLIDQAAQNPDIQDIVAQLTQVFGGGQDAQLFQTATVRRGSETLKKYGLTPGERYKTRDVAAALEARQRAKYGTIERDDRSAPALTKIAKWMQAEVEFEMENPGASGVGWYSQKFQRALDIMGQVFPELAADRTARNTMTALIAITSDGQKVVPNFAQAMDIYGNFRAGGATEGRFTTTRGHQRQASIDNNLKVMQRLYDQMGPEAMHEYLMQEKTISELKKIAKANGGELKSDYQAHIAMPMAAVEFGPKLGAFYANLMGAHGYLTMDRWWSRTFNRYRGTLLTAPTQVGLDRFKQLIGKPDISNDEAIAATVEYRNSYEARGFKNGTEIEKAANTIYKAAFEALEDAPFTATDRSFMLDAVSKSQQNLAKKGYNLSVADIQAILWYYEKRLYGELGARQSADISYEEAAQRVATSYASGSGIESLLDDADAAQADDRAAAGRVPAGEELYDDGSETTLYQSVSRRDLDFREVIRRTPELQVAAQQLQAGEITREQYEQLVNTVKPVEPYDEVPQPATAAQAIDALTEDKKERYGVPSKTLKNGHPVGLRLDIPAYSQKGVWVVSVHEQEAGFSAGKSIGYESVAAATDVTFGVVEKAAVNIAAGKPKATIAVMKGAYKKMTPAKAKAAADAALTDPAWRQVGMDPERHSYFYDRETMDPIVAAEEVIQIGPLVLAKNVSYGQREDFLFQGQQGMDDKRGFIQFGRDRKFNITLLEKANLSTFLHETGHFYLEVLGDLAEAEGASQAIKDDYTKVLGFLGATSRADITLDGKAPGSAEYNRAVEMHEKFARANEAYLMEGKAPSVELRSIFQTFKSWLSMIYRSMTELDVQLTDEVREVFDRIYATDAEIEAAKNEMSSQQLFLDAAAAGMTDAEFAAYKQSIVQATEAGKEALTAKLMREMQREQQAWWKEQLAKVREEVATEVDSQPVYKAFKALTTGMVDDDTPIKLNKQALVDKYGADYVKRLPRSIQRVYSTKGGMDADAAAEFLGFDSGDALIEALVGMRPRKELIEAEAEQRMKERHGDMMMDGSIAEEARIALHNSQREKVLAAELRALRRKQREVAPFVAVERQRQAGERRQARAAAETPPAQAFRAAARGIIGQTAVKDVQPQRYLMAQRRHAKAAFDAMAKGDYQVAADNKQKEMLNHFLYLEAIKAREDADKILKYATKFEKGTTREQMGKAGADYLEQIDALLDRYEFRRVPLSKLQRRASLAEWIAAQEAQGLEPSIGAQLLDESRTVNYRQASIDELRAIYDAVRNIEHLARLKNKLVTKGKEIEFQEAVAELVASAENNARSQKPLPVDQNARTYLEKVGDTASSLDSMLIKMEQIVEWLDGGNINGPWHTYIWNPLTDAQNAEYDTTRALTERLAASLEKMPKAQRLSLLDTFEVPGIGKVTRKYLISVALNMGNQGNIEKMIRGMGWDMGTIEGALSRLNDADWTFVQETWDTINSLWPQIAELEKRMTGIEPPKVEAQPYNVRDTDGNIIRTLEGGYYPLVYDPRRSEQGAKQETGNLGQLFEDGYIRATTPKGHTQARMEGFSAPLMFDFEQVVTQHMAKVVKDLTHREAVIAANKILTNREIRTVLQETLGPAYEKQMLPWLRSVVNDRNGGSVQGLADFSRWMLTMRANTVAAVMGFKATTAIAQIVGISQSLDKVKGRYIAGALQEFLRHPVATTRKVRELSGEMRNRSNTLDRDIRDQLRNLTGQNSKWAQAQRFAFHGIAIADAMVSVPTWMGAYKQALDAGADQASAILEADTAVRLTQGSSGAKDLSAIQRNNELAKLVTMFYSYFNVLYNRMRDMGRDVQSIKDMPRFLARATFTVMIPAVFGEIILGRGPDDDEDPALWAIRKVLLYPLMSVPVVRDVASSIDSGFDYRFSPAATVIEKIGKTAVDTGRLAEGDIEWGEYSARVAESIGYVFGVAGTAQVAGTSKYLWRVSEGEEDPENLAELLFYAAMGKRKEQ